MPTCHPFPLVIQRQVNAGGHGDWALCHFEPLPTPHSPRPARLRFVHSQASGSPSRSTQHAAHGAPTHHSFRPCIPIWIWWQTVRGRKGTKCERAATLIPPWVMEANRIESNRMVQNGIRPSKGRTTTCDAQAMTMVKPASRQTVIHVVPHITHPKLPGSGSPLPLSLVKPPATRTCSHFVGMDQWRVNSLHLVKKRPI